MTEVRKDSKGRKLLTGESQEHDGRYKYRYKDLDGERKSVYSWRLTSADKMPDGKRQDVPLRTKEREIAKNLENNISTDAGKIKVEDLVWRYVKLHEDHWADGTYKLNAHVAKEIEGSKLGKTAIRDIRISDAKEWALDLKKEGKHYSSINAMKRTLRAAYQMAIDDDLILKNPFRYSLSNVIEDDTKKRQAITKEEEAKFLEFVKNYPLYSKYYDRCFILFMTGIRNAELCGLTINDINFKDNYINIDHQLQTSRDGNIMVCETKTANSVRKIPMSQPVRECFSRVVAERAQSKVEVIVRDKDGNPYSGFLWLTKKGRPMLGSDLDSFFKSIVNAYNRTHTDKLPTITPHVARHTFCTNLVNANANVKQVQYIMGHADATMTLNLYSHVRYEDLDGLMDLACCL